jgi:heparosan-N-sulfate-glucuronate 5-epimerase
VRDAPRLIENKRLVEGQGLYTEFGSKALPLVTRYGLEAEYLTHSREFVAKFRDTGVEFDAQGVPSNLFRWGGPYRYSVTIGHHGLSSLARFVEHGDAQELQTAVNVANWLVGAQKPDGAWAVDFDHNWFPPRCQVIQAPWVSAMGQGLCISLLARLIRTTDPTTGQAANLPGLDRAALLRAARLATKPFCVDSAAGGVRALLHGQHVFYEEYPTAPNSFVLNGFIYALLGLYDLWLLDKDEIAGGLYRQGITTLKDTLHLFDLGRATAYDLTHLTCRGYPPNIARQSYHYIHVQLISALNLIEGGGFEAELERWSFYLRGWGVRTN